MKITVKQVEKLKLKDVLNADVLFPGLTDDPVVLTLMEKTGSSYVFDMHYLSVYIGSTKANVVDGALKFEEKL